MWFTTNVIPIYKQGELVTYYSLHAYHFLLIPLVSKVNFVSREDRKETYRSIACFCQWPTNLNQETGPRQTINVSLASESNFPQSHNPTFTAGNLATTNSSIVTGHYSIAVYIVDSIKNLETSWARTIILRIRQYFPEHSGRYYSALSLNTGQWTLDVEGLEHMISLGNRK